MSAVVDEVFPELAAALPFAERGPIQVEPDEGYSTEAIRTLNRQRVPPTRAGRDDLLGWPVRSRDQGDVRELTLAVAEVDSPVRVVESAESPFEVEVRNGPLCPRGDRGREHVPDLFQGLQNVRVGADAHDDPAAAADPLGQGLPLVLERGGGQGLPEAGDGAGADDEQVHRPVPEPLVRQHADVG
jgi:hypothetical protein